jgi:hypothetical protein
MHEQLSNQIEHINNINQMQHQYIMDKKIKIHKPQIELNKTKIETKTNKKKKSINKAAIYCAIDIIVVLCSNFNIISIDYRTHIQFSH